MTLPDIPDRSTKMAACVIGLDDWDRDPDCRLCRRTQPCPDHLAAGVLSAAWPHLYAAALRDVATAFAGDSLPWTAADVVDALHELADEAVAE